MITSVGDDDGRGEGVGVKRSLPMRGHSALHEGTKKEINKSNRVGPISFFPFFSPLFIFPLFSSPLSLSLSYSRHGLSSRHLPPPWPCQGKHPVLVLPLLPFILPRHRLRRHCPQRQRLAIDPCSSLLRASTFASWQEQAE